MVYIMEIYVDGGCRGNGQEGAIGAAAVAFRKKSGRYKRYKGSTRNLPEYPRPTNQRAEITAIILALELALKLNERLKRNPWLEVSIHSDSKYAVDCMTEWIYKWTKNGWINFAGNGVANRDLLEKASELDERLKEEGEVEYHWIPRKQNKVAEAWCNQAMDNQ